MKIKEIKKEYKSELKTVKKIYKTDKKENRTEYKNKRAVLKEAYREDYSRALTEKGKRTPIDPPKRAVLEEIGNAVTHGLGSVFSVFSIIFMLIYSDTTVEKISAWVYFFGLFVMFTMSCLYHSFAHGMKVKRIFRRFDYSCIYLLIGATFAPVLLSYIGGTFGLMFFIIQWAVIATGITFVGVFGPERLKFLHTPLYLVLGWCALIFLPRMFREDTGLAFFVLGGGVIYSLGIIPFAMKTKVAHFIWHFFVLAGAVVQWAGVFLYIYLP